mgnify:CR=1 FL=1
MRVVASLCAILRDSRSCFPCGIATYQPAPGSSSCVDCPAGKFGDTLGQTDCQLCPKGYQQPFTKRSECSPWFVASVLNHA